MENVWKVRGHEHADAAHDSEVVQVHGHDHAHVAQHSAVTHDLDYPCNDRRLQPKYLPACWGNQVSVLYKAFNGNLAKIAEKCDTLSDVANKESCFNGLARQIQPLTGGSADEAFRLCAMATKGQWQHDCLITMQKQHSL